MNAMSQCNYSSLLFGQILKAMGLTKTASSAANLLIDIGYFPVHVNLDLLKLNVPTMHSDEIISAAESLLLSQSVDLDEVCTFFASKLMKSLFRSEIG